jgi:hypothetical protein
VFEIIIIYLSVTNGYVNMKTQLLCTFTDINNYSNAIDGVTKFYDVVFGKVYLLQNKDNVNEILLTYNINVDNINVKSFYPNTISVHRKKDSNTLYTINSLNELIKQLNNGILDTRYSVDWKNYENTILLTDPVTGIKLIPTKLYQIIKI